MHTMYPYLLSYGMCIIDIIGKINHVILRSHYITDVPIT